MEEKKSGPAYFVKTERLVIRCWQPTDAVMLKEAVDENIEHLTPWMPWAAKEPTSLDEKIGMLRRFRGNFDLDKDFIYGIFDPQENRVLGGTGLHPRVGEGGLEIGYWIHHAFLNQGLATETAAALTQLVFKIHDLDRVEIRCDPENIRSAAIPRKLGYRLEATLKNHLKIAPGKWRDTMIWTLTRPDYARSPAKQFEIEARDAFGRQIL